VCDGRFRLKSAVFGDARLVSPLAAVLAVALGRDVQFHGHGFEV